MQLREALEQIDGMIDLVNALVLENQPESTEHAIRQLRDGMQAFAGMKIKTNFLCNLGYGDPAKLFARNPRLGFDEACALL